MDAESRRMLQDLVSKQREMSAQLNQMSTRPTSEGAEAPPEPMEPEVQNLTLQDLLRNDTTAQLAGSGTLLNNGWDRIFWRVDDAEPNVLTLQLVLDERLWAWKAIDVYNFRVGNWDWIRHLGVTSEIRVASVQLTTADMTGTIKLDFWKHGFLGFGSYLTTSILDVPTHLGKSIQFTVDRD